MTASHEKKAFEIIYNLKDRQPWTIKRFHELKHLLFEDCKNQSQRDLVLNLIERVEAFNHDRFNRALETLGKMIFDTQYPEDSVIIVALAPDSGSDSSHIVLYSLKSILERLGWRNYKEANRYDRAVLSFKEHPRLQNIILIDEFVGTGQTVINRVKTLTNEFIRRKLPLPTFSVFAVAGMEKGIDAVVNSGITIRTTVTLRRGISDYYSPAEAESLRALMIDLEGLLLPQFSSLSLPSLGYGKSEALYHREDGNAPNNVFPIFWWPFYTNSDKRPTIMTRAMR